MRYISTWIKLLGHCSSVRPEFVEGFAILFFISNVNIRFDLVVIHKIMMGEIDITLIVNGGLAGQDLTGASFVGSSLLGTDFSGAIVTEVAFDVGGNDLRAPLITAEQLHPGCDEVVIVDTNTGKVQTRMGSVGKLGTFAFSPDGERIAYIGSVNINDPREGRLYVVPSSGGERRELVPEYLGHVGNFIWSDDDSVRWLGLRGVYSEWATASLYEPQVPGPAPKPGPMIRTVHGNPG